MKMNKETIDKLLDLLKIMADDQTNLFNRLDSQEKRLDKLEKDPYGD